MDNHKTCLNPTCDARQPDCPWPDGEGESSGGNIKKIRWPEAYHIICHRIPSGKFLCHEGDRYVGIDNSTGDAWTEEFKTLDACLEWLRNLSVEAIE